ncbi:MAG TPA: hypothetical protein DCG72_05560 [Gammaproteobacteria bacterium]|nr:hypothetical protein [Gammaproteobacteria bacterium]
MADTTLTADVIAKEALAILDNELGVLNTFHRGHESEFSSKVNGYKIGDTLSIRRPADFTVRSGATLSTQDVIEGKVSLAIDQQRGVDFDFTSTDLTLKVSDLSERVIRPAMTNIINNIASDCMSQFYQGVYDWVGTAGQTINSFTDFAKGPERLDMKSVPTDMRCGALSPADHWAVVGSQTSLLNDRLVGQAYRNGSLGNIGGVDTYMSQVMPTHTTGTHTTGSTPVVNGASQNVTYDTAKNTWTQSLITDGWANSTAVLTAGDVFTIDDVYMVNTKTKAATNILQQFVVTAAGTSDGSGNLTLTISPPMITSGPHQTVDAAAADDAGINPVGTEGTGYVQNLMYHKNAFACCFVPMEMPQAAYNGSRQTYKNMSVRVIPIYDGTNDVSKWRLDVLYGRKVLDPRLATRVSGTA